jgi:TolB-like protein/tetratricopeptide (TPR) repeat protein
MKNIFSLLIHLFFSTFIYAQATRVAILDFDNISGIAKYDGLGKAMSSMLISDIEANVSPKRLQLVERAQIQKLLKEQNFQASSSVNKNTAVQAGKILGVNYLLVGDVYILNDQLIINARLTNTETGDIVFSKKQEGKTVAWLTLKTNIARDLALSLSQPFTEPTIPDKEVSVATITTFGNAVTAKDSGNVQMAETLTTTILDFSPDFKYVDDLRKEIDELKKQVAKNTADIKILTAEVNENVTDYLELGYKYENENNYSQAEKYFSIGLNKVIKSEIVDYLGYVLALSRLYYKNNKYDESLKYSEMGLDVYPYFKEFLYFKYASLVKLNRLAEVDEIVKIAQEYYNSHGSDGDIIVCLKKFSEKNKVNYYDIEKYLEWKLGGFSSLTKAIRFKNGEFYFNQYFEVPFNTIALEFIQKAYNQKPEHAASLLKQLELNNLSSEVKFSLAWYTMLSGDFINANKQWDDIVINDFWLMQPCADGKTMCVKAGINENSVVIVDYVYDVKHGIVYQDSIREYHPDGTIRSFDIPEVQRKKIELKKPFWYYEYEDGSGYVELNPIKAYIFKRNLQYPIDAIIDCIKSSGNITSISDSKKMALINWGHSYMLSGEISQAIKIYQLFPSDFKFSEDFQHMTFAQVLKSDWSEFVKRQLISKGMIEKMQTLIITNKN